MSAMRKWLPVVLLVCSTRVASAQFGAIEALIRNVEDVGVYTHFGWPTDRRSVRPRNQYWSGFGFELSYKIYEHQRIKNPFLREADRQLKRSRAEQARIEDAAQEEAARELRLKAGTPDTAALKTALKAKPDQERATAVEETVQIKSGDSTRTRKYALSTQTLPVEREPDWIVEFAIAYSQVQSYHRTLEPVGPGLDSGEVRGGIRELPVASVYVSHSTVIKDFAPWLPFAESLAPYGSAFGGLVQLTGLRAFSPNGPLVPGQPAGVATFKGEGNTFEGGLSLGLSFSVPQDKLHLFVEGAHSWRVLPSVDWSGAPGQLLYPKSLPRTLDLSAWSLTIGVQAHVGK